MSTINIHKLLVIDAAIPDYNLLALVTTHCCEPVTANPVLPSQFLLVHTVWPSSSRSFLLWCIWFVIWYFHGTI